MSYPAANSISAEGVEEIAKLLSLASHIRCLTLDLSRLDFRNPTARKVAELLSQNTSIVSLTLRLRESRIGAKGATQVIQQLLARAPHLASLSLDLAFTSVSDQTVARLATVLARNTTLGSLSLELKSTLITTVGVIALGKALAMNTHLTSLFLDLSCK